MERFSGNERVADYQMVVLDAAACTASADLAASALDAGVPVLVLGAHDEAKAVLARHIGFRSAGDSAAYLVAPLKDEAGGTHFHILEQALPAAKQEVTWQEAAGEGEGMKECYEAHTEDMSDPSGVLQPTREELKGFGRRVRALLKGERQRKALAGDIPAGLKWKSWVYSVDQTFTASGSKSSLGTPKQQTLSCFTTYEFTAFLNNWPETGAFQYLVLQQTGIYQTNGLVKNDDHERGWYLTELAPSFQASSPLFYYQSSPPNVAGSKSVTTTSGFAVNFNNGGAGATYNYSSSETNVISDWKVAQLTGTSWQYSQVDPYNGTTNSFPGGMVESNDKGELKGLPDISKYSLQFDVQTVWKTNEVVQSEVSVGCTNTCRTDYIITEYDSGTKWEGYWWTYIDTRQPSFTIDLGVIS
jgi:hypothetical protein